MRLKRTSRLWSAVYFFLISIWFPFSALADELILNQDVDQAISLTPYYQVHVDPQHDLTIHTILSSQSSTNFQPLIDGKVNLGFKAETYWFKVNIINASSDEIQPLLELDYPLLDDLSVYIVNHASNKIITRYDAGDMHPFAERHYSAPNFVFPVTLAANSTTDLYLRIRTEGSMFAGGSLQHQDNYRQQSRMNSFYINLYLGILIALIAYNFLLFISIKQSHYGYLILVGCSILLATGSLNAIWFELIWPNSPSWHNLSITFGFAMTGMFAAAFSRNFLHTAAEAKNIDFTFQALILAFALLALSSLALPLIYIAPFVSMLAIILATVSILAAIALSLKGNRYAQIYLFAWLSLMLGIALFSAKNLGWLPSNIYTRYSFEIGSALGMLLLSLSLAERIKFFQQENDNSRQEAFQSHNKLIHVLRNSEQELNHRVKERTEALAKANNELQNQEEKLQRLAHFDPLTGLANRFLVTQELTLLLARCKREQSKLAVLFLDLDGFKQINDQYGHQAGDELLVATADKLRYILRDSDVIGRFGGDEFIVIIDTSDGNINPEEVADKIKATIILPVAINGISAEIGVSIGIAIYPDTASDVDSLLSISDREMYKNKQHKVEPVLTSQL